VVTYTYKPLIGVTTITDANNKTNTYEYDVLNRLILIKDQDNNAVKKIEYTYNGPDTTRSFMIYYNTAISRPYTCHSCDTGSVGSSVTYYVPAGKWFSTVSQASAQAKAAADTVANGQLYADRNGTCTVGNCGSSCNASNCTGVEKKCINGVCETGVRVNTSSVKNKFNNLWTCTYHYLWSDSSISQDYTEVLTAPCTITEL
jgi:YD repeat-containing protein